MPGKNQEPALYIVYAPTDLYLVTKVATDLRKVYQYDHPIILVPKVGRISDRDFLICGTHRISIAELYTSLVNVSEIIALQFNPATRLPVYPDHSFFLIEFDEETGQINKTVWESDKYLDDIGTFTPRAVRRAEMEELMIKMAYYDHIEANKKS